MEVKYVIRYLEVVVKEHIPDLPSKARNLIKRAIDERLAVDPVSFGKPLRYSLKGHRRLRVGDYRVVYKIDPNNSSILIIAIKHRKEVYDVD